MAKGQILYRYKLEIAQESFQNQGRFLIGWRQTWALIG